MDLSKRSAWVAIVAVVASVLLPACDWRPAPPTNAEGDRINVLVVSGSQPEELKAAAEVEAAKIDYRYRLEVLEAYYDNVGNVDKYLWARKEMKNLQDAWTFEFGGLPMITPPGGESLEGADEPLLVERVVDARKKYRKLVANLAERYHLAGKDFETRVIRNVEERFDPVRTYMYYPSAELPPEEARPVAMIPEADAMFADAVALHRKGKGILHIAPTTNYGKQRQALVKFHQLVAKYPTSNKVALSCYCVGEIYKEYFNENLRSVYWYQRAWQLDPNITKPARFQAATVYDFRLQDKDKAVELYRLAIKYEQFNSSNVRYSHQRIGELTGQE